MLTAMVCAMHYFHGDHPDNSDEPEGHTPRFHRLAFGRWHSIRRLSGDTIVGDEETGEDFSGDTLVNEEETEEDEGSHSGGVADDNKIGTDHNDHGGDDPNKRPGRDQPSAGVRYVHGPCAR
ncbi:hypothetical protein PG994_002562 [Apiospora phragmitis]|uniref:Uncharacterized protein n=1 Tax=Apiospora phragmitis TaxID=2905665 RepID=A0ABR1W8B4_9PEZI